MISFQTETNFKLKQVRTYKNWLKTIIEKENKKTGEIVYLFCNDEKMLEINQKFLQHDFYTDIITFDNTEGQKISGDIIISVDRVKENAQIYGVTFQNELKRVIAHGVLHLLGYKDKTKFEQDKMRQKEEESIILFGQTTLW
ncbi:MAG: rRNA maturation RNase YbeY [Bacteroidales bacterium]|jgi:rRNA maturation RNase YbeY|nr:rRNA maturation RNase YbeY [Bacteroidales bacterium]